MAADSSADIQTDSNKIVIDGFAIKDPDLVEYVTRTSSIFINSVTPVVIPVCSY